MKKIFIAIYFCMSAFLLQAQSLGGVDLSRFVYGDNATKTSYFGDPNNALSSGFYNQSTSTNMPYNTWWHLISNRHINTDNNYQFQIAADFWGDNTYFRKVMGSSTSTTAWRRFLNDGQDLFAANLNQNLRITDNVVFNSGLFNGNVSIGSSTPPSQYQLDVHGSNAWDGSTQLGIVNNASLYGRAQMIITGRLDGGNDGWSNNPRAGVVFNRNNGSSQGAVGTMGYAIQMELNSQSLGFVNSSGILNLEVKQNGNIGIGTANTLNYKLAVEGTIGARKIKVSQENWADYVFAPTYKLLPLQDLETYIKKTQHLPDVPSTTDVAKNGIDLGDNQALLLKKIEELTLYMIEQGKSFKKQEQENKTQALLIARIQKELKDLKKKTN